MITVARTISDIKSEFEGGSALAVDYYAILRRASDNVLDKINPETLKRRISVYGGLAKDLQIYYCPADLEAPSDIYENDGRFGNQQKNSRVFRYVPTAIFYAVENEINTSQSKYTIEYINGARFIIIRHTKTPASITIEEMDATTGITSDQTLSLNEHDFVYGTGALQRTFSEETGTAFTIDFTTDFLTSAAHGLSNGDRVMVFSGTTLPAGLSANTVYFVVSKTTDTFKLSLTSGGSAINMTDDGTGTHKWRAATQNEVSKTITAVNITDYLKGIAVVPLNFENAAYVNRVELVLETDTENYYTLTSTEDSVGDSFVDGMNMVRFWMASANITGSPAPANIVKWRLRVILDDGATAQTVIMDRITVQKNSHYNLEYYSNRMFADGTTGAWKDTPVKGDNINLGRTEIGILHYEAVVLIAQNSSFVSISAKELENFISQLERKYESYEGRHPSSEMPLSYNTLPSLAEDILSGLGGEQLDIETTSDVVSTDVVYQFADNVELSGEIDGINTIFVLPHTPNPTASVILALGGLMQTVITDYTLSGATITFIIAPPIGSILRAFFRYI